MDLGVACKGSKGVPIVHFILFFVFGYYKIDNFNLPVPIVFDESKIVRVFESIS